MKRLVRVALMAFALGVSACSPVSDTDNQSTSPPPAAPASVTTAPAAAVAPDATAPNCKNGEVAQAPCWCIGRGGAGVKCSTGQTCDTSDDVGFCDGKASVTESAPTTTS